MISNALEFLLGERCAGCDGPVGRLCAEGVASFHEVDPPTTPGGLTVHSALAYEGAVSRSIRSLKEGRTSLARDFARFTTRTLAAAGASDAAIVTVPTSPPAYRRRGFRVPDLLVRRGG